MTFWLHCQGVVKKLYNEHVLNSSECVNVPASEWQALFLKLYLAKLPNVFQVVGVFEV